MLGNNRCLYEWMKEISRIYFFHGEILVPCKWIMTDNINKISSKVDGNVQQQTAASIVNLTDDGKPVTIFILTSMFYGIEKRTDKR